MGRLLTFIACVGVVATLGCSGCDDLGQPDLDGCGDGVRRGGEACDGNDFGGLTCADYGFTGGELRCAPSCAGVVVAECSGVSEQNDQTCRPLQSCEARCEGEPFVADQQLQFDITTVPLTVELTRGGEPLPPGDDNRRGVLSLRGEVWWEPIEVPVPADGPAIVETPVYPDAYQVEWRPAATDLFGPLELGTITVEDDARHTFDLEPLTEVEVSVSVNGEPFSESAFDEERTGPRGFIVVERPDTRSFVAAELPDEGAAVATVRLQRGPYRVWWAHDGVIEFIEETEIVTDFSVDLPLVHVEPRITLNGLPPVLPTDATFDATLTLEKTSAGPTRLWTKWRRGDLTPIALDRNGEGSAWVLKDEYEVQLQANAPRLRGLLRLHGALAIESAQSASHFDVSLTPVAGSITRNGRRVPYSQRSGAPRGRLTFEKEDGSYVGTEIAGSGPAEFSFALPPGTWKVRVTGDPWSGTLPLVSTTIDSSFSVGDSPLEEVEFDVPVVRFLGQLTLNGDRMPDEREAEARGSLEIRARDGNIGYNLPISRTGPALFDVLLAPDAYVMQIARWWFAVGDGPPPDGVLPLGTWPVGDVDVSSTTQRDIDLRTFQTRFELVEHGEPLRPTDSEMRGELWIEDVELNRVSRRVEVPADGPAEVTTTLYPGHYRVIFQPDPSMEALPLQPVQLTTLSVGEDLDETLDVGGITLAGSVTVNGQPLGETPQNHGTISFLRFPTVADTTVDSEVTPNFEIHAAPGPYNVFFHPAPEHPLLPNGAVLLSKDCVDTRLASP